MGECGVEFGEEVSGLLVIYGEGKGKGKEGRMGALVY